MQADLIDSTDKKKCCVAFDKQCGKPAVVQGLSIHPIVSTDHQGAYGCHITLQSGDRKDVPLTGKDIQDLIKRPEHVLDRIRRQKFPALGSLSECNGCCADRVSNPTIRQHVEDSSTC